MNEKKCKKCNKILSIYNKKDTCYACQEAAEGIPVFKLFDDGCTSLPEHGRAVAEYDYQGYVNPDEYL